MVALDERSTAIEVCPGCGIRLQAHSTLRHANPWKTTSVVLKVQLAILLILLGSVAVGIARVNVPVVDGGAAICLVYALPLVYFVCICLCATAPDRTAKRSVIACVLTLGMATIAWFAVSLWMYMRRNRPPDFMLDSAVGFGAFSTYFAALVFLMRFHAAVARALGNERLRRESYVFMAAPIIAAAVNIGFEQFRVPRPFAASLTLVELSQIAFNFAVVGWYAVIVFRTFRTIDRGPIAKPSSSLDSLD
jgi:hypothetical protein